MSRERGRPQRWVVILTALFGALLVAAVVVVVATPHAHPVRAASAQRPADVAAATPSVTFIGDSWTAGTGATALRGYAVLTGEQLGWRYQLLGVGGSGYDVQGHGSVFGDRIDRAVSTHPDVIVVQGSINERASTARSLAASALATLTRLRSAAGAHTKILVVGASYVPGVPAATVNWINATERTAAATAGVRFVNPAAQEWTNPANKRIWADALHPNDVGHQLVANHLETLLRGMLTT